VGLAKLEEHCLREPADFSAAGLFSAGSPQTPESTLDLPREGFKPSVLHPSLMRCAIEDTGNPHSAPTRVCGSGSRKAAKSSDVIPPKPSVDGPGTDAGAHGRALDSGSAICRRRGLIDELAQRLQPDHEAAICCGPWLEGRWGLLALYPLSGALHLVGQATTPTPTWRNPHLQSAAPPQSPARSGAQRRSGGLHADTLGFGERR
jgi:hypothetical protein